MKRTWGFTVRSSNEWPVGLQAQPARSSPTHSRRCSINHVQPRTERFAPAANDPVAMQEHFGRRAESWRHVQGGIAALASRFGEHNSVAYINAKKALEFSMLSEEEKAMPINAPITEDLDLSSTDVASMDDPIPEHNRGFQLLRKMGWKSGTGLGKSKQGILDPLRIEPKSEVLGLGAETFDRELSKKVTSERKRLQSENELNETAEEAQERLSRMEAKAKQEQEAADNIKNLYCSLCNKQYTKAIEYQGHLDSYDHNHRKRFAEMRKERLLSGSAAPKSNSNEDKLLTQRIKAAEAETKAISSDGAVAKSSRALDASEPRPALKFSFKSKLGSKR